MHMSKKCMLISIFGWRKSNTWIINRNQFSINSFGKLRDKYLQYYYFQVEKIKYFIFKQFEFHFIFTSTNSREKLVFKYDLNIHYLEVYSIGAIYRIKKLFLFSYYLAMISSSLRSRWLRITYVVLNFL